MLKPPLYISLSKYGSTNIRSVTNIAFNIVYLGDVMRSLMGLRSRKAMDSHGRAYFNAVDLGKHKKYFMTYKDIDYIN